MAVKSIRVRTAVKALDLLRAFAQSDANIFRGHSHQSWRLESTLVRHVRGKMTDLAVQSMGDKLDHYFACLASIGQLPERPMSLRSKLEFARHYGVPSPLIDFTRSPFVALWMAFNGVRPWDPGNVALYVLNVNSLGILWQKAGGSFDDFRWSERGEQFDGGYPVGILRYLEFPSSWNVRMLRQLGVFIYDSMAYHKGPHKDLEEFIERGVDPNDPDGNPLYSLQKILIQKSVASDIFLQLELMGIDGTRLYNNHEGAAADVKNGYVFNRRTGYAHDIIVPQPPATGSP